jgi:hypothetical protein
LSKRLSLQLRIPPESLSARAPVTAFPWSRHRMMQELMKHGVDPGTVRFLWLHEENGFHERTIRATGFVR